MDRFLPLPRRATAVLFAGALTALVGLAPSEALAGPRDDMKVAYDKALADANNFEYDAALKTLNDAITAANDAGYGEDPVLASLYLLRAALTYSAEGEAARDRIVADLKGAVILNYYVVVPIEMRSDELTGFLQEARSSTGMQAPQPITPREPAGECGGDLHFEVLLSVPDGGSAALYWRVQGSEADFVGAEMPAFSNVAETDIAYADHDDANIEYFIYAFDASNNPVANLGLQDQPLVFERDCAPEEPPPEEIVEPPPEEPKPEVSLPRGWINLGIGTGLGIARVEAENTYRQFFPQGAQSYGAAEAGCAIARWVAGNRDIADLSAAELTEAFNVYGAAGQTMAMQTAFDAGQCAERHPVSTGMAIAPLHISPEISIRVGKRIAVGVYSRLQVVTGASVFRDDPDKDLDSSFAQDVRSPNPQGVKQKIAFSWTVGAKFKYFLGKDQWKVRPYVGAFGGYGHARLRVDMGFANDRNGNSVPDNLEIGSDTDPTGTACYPVWPYNNGCSDGATEGDNLLALQVATNADASNRIDVVRIGPVFLGGLVGFNYQLHKNFALFGEAQIGGYFPSQGSMLIDITLGPAISF